MRAAALVLVVLALVAGCSGGGGSEVPEPGESLLFTYEQQPRVLATEDVALDHGRLVLTTSDPDGCRVVPEAIRRTAPNDVRIRFRRLTDQCDPAMLGTKVRITLEGAPFRSPFALFRDDARRGVLLPSRSLPLLAPDAKDCGTARLHVGVRQSAFEAPVVCLGEAAEQGAPAVLVVSDLGAFTGRSETYEVYGRQQVRVTTATSSDASPVRITVDLCEQVDVTSGLPRHRAC